MVKERKRLHFGSPQCDESIEELQQVFEEASREKVVIGKDYPEDSKEYDLQERVELSARGAVSISLTDLTCFDLGHIPHGMEEEDYKSINRFLRILQHVSYTPRIHHTKELKTEWLVDVCHALNNKGYPLPQDFRTYLNVQSEWVHSTVR